MKIAQKRKGDADDLGIDSETYKYCRRHRLGPYIAVARRLAARHFDASGPIVFTTEEDSETGERYLDMNLTVKGEIESVLNAYDRFTDEWIKSVPAGARERIKLAYQIA